MVDVTLRVDQSPVQLKVDTTTVQLVLSGARGSSGLRGIRGPGATIGLAYTFQGLIVDSERLPGYPIYSGATYDLISGWCSMDASTDAVFHLYNKDVYTGITVTFQVGVSAPVLSAPLTVVAGDYIWPKGPSPGDSTLMDPAFVLYSS